MAFFMLISEGVLAKAKMKKEFQIPWHPLLEGELDL